MRNAEEAVGETPRMGGATARAERVARMQQKQPCRKALQPAQGSSFPRCGAPLPCAPQMVKLEKGERGGASTYVKPPLSHAIGLDLLTHFSEQERERFESSDAPLFRPADPAQAQAQLDKLKTLEPNAPVHRLQLNPSMIADRIVPPLPWERVLASSDLSPAWFEKNMNFVTATVRRGQDPTYKLAVHEIITLLRAPRWDLTGAAIECRPLVIEQPEARMLFREPTQHKRRQKLSVGSIDRWKNSGGKRAVVTTPIPEQFRLNDCNVIVQRHGRVLRPDGLPQLRYRQWSFGVLPGGSAAGVVEEKHPGDKMLYQVFPIDFDTGPTAGSVLSGVNLGLVACEDAIMLSVQGPQCSDLRLISIDSIEAMPGIRATTLAQQQKESGSVDTGHNSAILINPSLSGPTAKRRKLNLGEGGGAMGDEDQPVTSLDYSQIGGSQLAASLRARQHQEVPHTRAEPPGEAQMEAGPRGELDAGGRQDVRRAQELRYDRTQGQQRQQGEPRPSRDREDVQHIHEQRQCDGAQKQALQQGGALHAGGRHDVHRAQDQRQERPQGQMWQEGDPRSFTNREEVGHIQEQQRDGEQWRLWQQGGQRGELHARNRQEMWRVQPGRMQSQMGQEHRQHHGGGVRQDVQFVQRSNEQQHGQAQRQVQRPITQHTFI